MSVRLWLSSPITNIVSLENLIDFNTFFNPRLISKCKFCNQFTSMKFFLNDFTELAELNSETKYLSLQ